MSPRQRRNMAASVKQRLLNVAKARGEVFNFLLTRYAIERLLYRIAQSEYTRDFVLKGAMLFHLASKRMPHRPTRDVDLLARGAPDPPRLESIFHEIIKVHVDDDGLVFLKESLQAERIREEDEYAGVRLRMEARMGAARIPLQVDVGFGDAPIPLPRRAELDTLLDLPAPRLLIYPWEAVISEKFHILVDLGMRNTRMKDYFDLEYLSATLSLDGQTLARAIRATFERRRMPLLAEVPVGLTQTFAEAPAKRTQWRAFLGRLRLDAGTIPLDEVTGRLQRFLMPPVEALLAKREFKMKWPPGGPWGR